MNITRENIDELNGIIRVSIEKADYESKVDEVLNDYRKKANMPGFRPGKIPLGLVKKMYGKAALVEEVNKLLSSELSKYLVEEKLNILGEPLPNEELQKDIDWEKDADFEFVFDIGFAPEAKVSLDKRSKYTQYKIAVSDEMINEQVEAYTNRFGESKAADTVSDKGTVRGDIVQLDENGNEKEDGHKVDMALISIEVIKDEEIKKNFVGKKADDEVVFDIRKAYPNDTELSYLLNIEKENAAEISGDYKITIKEINQFEPAEINEELFKKIYGDDTEIKDEKALREKVRGEITDAYVPSSDYKFALDARDTLVAKAKMDFPEAFLKRWLKATNKELSEEQIEKDFEHFLADLKWQIIKDDLIKENDLKVDEAEVNELAIEVAAAQFRQYGMFDVPEEHLQGFAQQMLSKEEDRNRLFSKKMEDKIMEVIKSKVNVEEKEVAKEEFDQLFE
ncbi:trigger factor [Roseimarinus sediminis]|uniref:trigger factor n=1 Tax=Roseimarinus sediminis TaxID=1610899 RepID=UPI003D20F707